MCVVTCEYLKYKVTHSSHIAFSKSKIISTKNVQLELWELTDMNKLNENEFYNKFTEFKLIFLSAAKVAYWEIKLVLCWMAHVCIIFCGKVWLIEFRMKSFLAINWEKSKIKLLPFKFYFKLMLCMFTVSLDYYEIIQYLNCAHVYNMPLLKNSEKKQW